MNKRVYDIWLDNPVTGRFVARFTSDELSSYLVRSDVTDSHKDRLRLIPVDPTAPRYRWWVKGIGMDRGFYSAESVAHFLIAHYDSIPRARVTRYEIRQDGLHCWQRVESTTTVTAAREWLDAHFQLAPRQEINA